MIGTIQHRHLIHDRLTLAAIDDSIARGKRQDWADLADAMLADPATRERILRLCAMKVSDPYAQRYHFWKRYAEHHAPG